MTQKVTSPMPDVVFFVPNIDGGVGSVTATLAKGVHTQGKITEIWSASPGGQYVSSVDKGVHIKTVGSGLVRSSFLEIRNQLRVCVPKTIIAASFHANCLLVLASLFTKQKPKIVLAEHTSLTTAMQELPFFKQLLWCILIRLLYPRADAYVAVSEGVAQSMAKHGGIKRSHITVIPNPVISEELYAKSTEAITHAFFENDTPTLLFVGRLSKEKDLPNLLTAVALVQQKTPIQLLVIGDGPERTHLEQLAVEKDIQAAFLGHVANPYPYFKQSDVFVLPSRREGLPTVLIEALALGTKVVSTDCQSGPREILHNGAYGALVPVGDSRALADGIENTLKKDIPNISPQVLAPYETQTAVSAYTQILV